MKVRDALLALLACAPAHGYQLKGSYESLAGGGPLNVGQIYQTIDRLERDRLVTKLPDSTAPERVGLPGQAPDRTADQAGNHAVERSASPRRITYALTADGRAEAHALLTAPTHAPVPTNGYGRSDVAIKVLAALAIDHQLAFQVIDIQRSALLQSLTSMRRATRRTTPDVGEEPSRANVLAKRLAREADVVGIESELRWLDLAEAEMRSH